MARFYGKVGYAITEETAPGVYEEKIVERPYFGDVTRISSRLQGSEQLNDTPVINNTFSILADAFAYDNFSAIRYIEWMGNKWKIRTVEVRHPRLIFTLGGLYNE